MKIIKIEEDEKFGIYNVTFKPNWLQKFFGAEEETKKYKDTGRRYTFGGGKVYVDQTGRELGNNIGYGCNIREAIDRFRRSF